MKDLEPLWRVLAAEHPEAVMDIRTELRRRGEERDELEHALRVLVLSHVDDAWARLCEGRTSAALDKVAKAEVVLGNSFPDWRQKLQRLAAGLRRIEVQELDEIYYSPALNALRTYRHGLIDWFYSPVRVQNEELFVQRSGNE